MDQNFTVHLDNPSHLPETDWVEVRGWIVGDQPIEELSLKLSVKQQFANEARPDVQAAFPDKPFVAGFRQQVQRSLISDGVIQLTGHTGGQAWQHHFTVEPAPHSTASHEVEKTALPQEGWTERLRPLLAMPGGESPREPEQINEAWTGERFCFLSAKEAEELRADKFDRVSAHAYPQDLQQYLNENPDIIALDCGAGLRKHQFPQVINLEPIAYPSTHVQSMAEKLPFRDNSFDLVFCLSVLEHLRDPFAAAREMLRVLKPGGRIFLEVPFLIQVHGYPNHYYNMTPQGLANLVDEQCTVLDQMVPNYGHPIQALTPFIKTWHDGLPEDAQKDFRKMTLGELLDDPKNYYQESWVKKLPHQVQANIAALNRVVAIKNS